jgi:hypothetical protein
MYNPRHVDPNQYILGQSLTRCIKPIIGDVDFGVIEVVNLFSKTSKSQDELLKRYHIFEELNFEYIKIAVEGSNMIVLAWGGKGAGVSIQMAFTQYDSKRYSVKEITEKTGISRKTL